MGNSNYVLAIDNGTQSVRAMVFDGDGGLVPPPLASEAESEGEESEAASRP